jgi:hypothetical protein
VGWNGSNEAPTKNDVYDKIEDILDGCTFTGDIVVPDEAYGAGWNGSLEVPTKNAVYDQIQSLTSATALPPNYQDIKLTYLSSSTLRILAGGRVRDEADTTNVVFSSNYTLDMSDSTPDSTQGGRSVAESASTYYYVYVGLDGSNNPIAWLDTADLSTGGSPTNPASYVSGRKQLNYKIFNNSSSNISGISTLNGSKTNRVLISEQIPSTAVASITFTDVIGYRKYILEFSDFTPATNGAGIEIALSTDNGSTWITTGYVNSVLYYYINTSTVATTGTDAFRVGIGSESNVAGNGFSGELRIYGMNNPIQNTRAEGGFKGVSGSPVPYGCVNVCERNSDEINNAIKVACSTGNIQAGCTIRLIGEN